jgi:hypothetical protein
MNLQKAKTSYISEQMEYNCISKIEGLIYAVRRDEKSVTR